MRSSGFTTGVEGLDMLLGKGGLCLPPSGNGLVILIKGAPGSGKTTLALQIASAAIKWRQRKNIAIYSHEQYEVDIQSLLNRLAPEQESANPESILIKGKDKKDGEGPVDAELSSISWMRDRIVELNKESKKYSLLIIDGLNHIVNSEQHLLQTEKIINVLQKKAKVGILVYEPGGNGMDSVDFQADLVLELKGESTSPSHAIPAYYLQKMRIVKSRFQKSVLGWHQYKIGEQGITVFPSIHFRIHQANPKNANGHRNNDDIPSVKHNFEESYKSLDKTHPKGSMSNPDSIPTSIIGKMLGGEHLALDNSVTVVLGGRRSWKTQLTLDWLRQGSYEGERGLLVSLMDKIDPISQQSKKLCDHKCNSKRKCGGKLKCYSNAYVYYFRPGCIGSCEFFNYLCKRIEGVKDKAKNPEHKIQRLLFWDLAQLEYRFPLLAADPLFLPGLIDYLKHRQRIPSVFMGPANTNFAKVASAIADNVIFCWQDYKKDSQIQPKSVLEVEKDKFWCFYVDRVTGEAGKRKSFHYIQDSVNGKIYRDLSFVESELGPNSFYRANPYIEAIQTLQGLPISYEKRSESVKESFE